VPCTVCCNTHQEFVAEKQQLQLELVQSQETEKENRRKLTAIYSAREKKLKQQSKAEIDQLKAQLAETTKLVKQLTQQQQQQKQQQQQSEVSVYHTALKRLHASMTCASLELDVHVLTSHAAVQ
jgi:chromosome segregation ATPase